MPRSPSEGASTRGPADLDVARQSPTRDRRVRSGVDRRNADHGPPEGIPERRHRERRSHDRRTHQRVDRRNRERRSSTSRRGSGVGSTHHARASRPPSPRVYVMPTSSKRSPTAKIFRALVITLVGLACLLAATLTESPNSGGSAHGLGSTAAHVLHLDDADQPAR